MDIDFRTVAPDKHPVFELNTPLVEEFVLENGIPCWYLHSSDMELIRLDFKFKAGSWYQNKPFVASFTGKMLYEGTKNYTSGELAEKFDSKGVYFGVTPEMDNVSIVFYIPRDFFNEILPLIYEMIYEPIFPENELETLVKKEIMSLKVNLKKGASLSRYHFRSNLFGENHPYGIFPEIEYITNVKREDLVAFHSQNYLSSKFTMYLTGNIDSNLLKELDSVFGKKNIQNANSMSPKYDIVSCQTNTPLHFELEDSVQSSIRIGRLMMTRNHPDYIDMAILTTVLGGYFGSRLMANIREDKGYTYGVGASIVSLLHSGYLSVQTDVGKNVSDKAVKEIYFEMEKLCSEKISEQELERVKQYLSGSLLRSIDGAVNIMDKFIDLDDFGLGVDYFQFQMNSIIHVTSDRLLDLAQKNYQKHDLIEVVVG